MNLDDFNNTVRQMCANDTVEFALNGKRDKEGNITITSFSIVQKTDEKKRPAGFRSVEP